MFIYRKKNFCIKPTCTYFSHLNSLVRLRFKDLKRSQRRYAITEQPFSKSQRNADVATTRPAKAEKKQDLEVSYLKIIAIDVKETLLFC